MDAPPKHLVEAWQREKEAAELKRQKEAILKDANKDHTENRFIPVVENIDDRLKNQTVGLVSLNDFVKTRADLEEEDRQIAAQTKLRDKEQSDSAKRKRKKKQAASKLSFGDEEEGDGDSFDAAGADASAGVERASKIKRLTKDPKANTIGLPDRERDEADRLERERLRKEYMAEQERIKGEVIEIVYSYWDGSGHRKSVEVKKGDDIATFLSKCRAQFPELRGTTIDNLMYIKEDLIIPHSYTFYDFIINKARGKSGPLFNFDVHDDVRLVSDATREKDESHAGKVVERAWYNRFKHVGTRHLEGHLADEMRPNRWEEMKYSRRGQPNPTWDPANREIFPASRWEIYDPSKSYGSYSIA